MTTKLHLDAIPRTIDLSFDGERLRFSYLDERLLPQQCQVVDTCDWHEVVDAIALLGIRGAPAIGVSGAAAVALWVVNDAVVFDDEDFCEALHKVCEKVSSTRPTAINLRWSVAQIEQLALRLFDDGVSFAHICQAMYDFVSRMAEEDEQTNRAIGKNGLPLVPEHARILTHCNAGSLATVFYGTALGVVYAAAEQGRVERVYCDETRPVGQGSRLTAWELSRAGVPTTLICDNMAASLMARGAIDMVVVGADRITRNGDVANKIGTYSVAVNAAYHKVPFYVAAPLSSFDFTLESGAEIPIEQRDASELIAQPLDGVEVYNPAFDVTPACLIAGIITEKGVFKPSELGQLAEGE